MVTELKLFVNLIFCFFLVELRNIISNDVAHATQSLASRALNHDSLAFLAIHSTF